MPEYKYTAKAPDGTLIQETKQSANQATLAREIKDRGLFLISVVEPNTRSNFITELFAPTMSNKELGIFCRQVAAMLNAGVTLVRALDIFYQQAITKTIKEIVRKLYEDVQRGDMFSDALRRQPHVFPALMISIIESGEASGTLERSVERMASQFENEDKLKGKVISAMIYPAVLAVIAIAAVIIMLVVVLPNFIDIYRSAGSDLPGPTMALLAASNFLMSYWPIILAALVVLTIAFLVYKRSEDGERAFDRLVLMIPVVKGTITYMTASRFTRTMANLTSSGLPLLAALEISARVSGNRIIGDKIMDAREEVRTGVSLSQAIYKIHEFPPLVYSMISIGEESGSLAELLDRVSGYLDEEVNTKIARLLTLLEPALMVIMAVVIGFVVIAIMMPIFGITGQIA